MHRLTFYLKFSRQRNTKCSAWRAGWVAMTAKPPQSLQASACSDIKQWAQVGRTEYKCWLNFDSVPFMCVIPHLCHTHTARAAKVTAQSVPPALGLWHSWLRKALGRLSPKRSSWFRDKLQSQGSAWPVNIWNTWLHRDIRGKVDSCPKSPISSFFHAFVVWLSFTPQKPRWGFVLALQIHCSVSPRGFFWAHCFPHEPNCLRKVPEEGPSGGNTGTENKGMALRTHWAFSFLLY